VRQCRRRSATPDIDYPIMPLTQPVTDAGSGGQLELDMITKFVHLQEVAYMRWFMMTKLNTMYPCSASRSESKYLLPA
jgi:hypothetical protein